MAHGVSSPDVCPVCGESVPSGSRACPGCGADERSGWNQDATRYDGLDLPDGAFSEDTERAARRKYTSGLWLAVGLGLLVLVIVGLISH
jgi:hypothetical protein